MKKITFERDNDGCFTNENVANYSISTKTLVGAMIGEIINGTVRKLHDIFSDKLLWIVVPVTDEDGNTVFEKVRALLTNDGECPLDIDSDCPFKNGKMFDEFGRWWDIEDTDVAFTDEEDANKMEFFSNLLAIFETKADFLTELTHKSPVEIFGEDNCPSYEEVVAFAENVMEDLEHTLGFIAAAKVIISEIGTEEE